MLSLQQLYPVISAVLALIMVIIVTVLGERWGTRVGGLVGTIPSLLIIALIFIALSSGPEHAASSASIVILEMGANITFLSVYLLTLHKGLPFAFLSGMAVWALLSFGILFTHGFGVLGNSLLYFGSLAVNLTLVKKIDISVSVAKIRYTPKELAFRGILGGGAIGTAVFLSKIGGPVIGGIFAVFPAIFISTMLIYTLRHSFDVPRSMGKSMMLGSLNVFSYALAASFSFPLFGVWYGSLLSLLASIGTSACLVYITGK